MATIISLAKRVALLKQTLHSVAARRCAVRSVLLGVPEPLVRQDRRALRGLAGRLALQGRQGPLGQLELQGQQAAQEPQEPLERLERRGQPVRQGPWLGRLVPQERQERQELLDCSALLGRRVQQLARQARRVRAVRRVQQVRQALQELRARRAVSELLGRRVLLDRPLERQAAQVRQERSEPRARLGLLHLPRVQVLAHRPERRALRGRRGREAQRDLQARPARQAVLGSAAHLAERVRATEGRGRMAAMVAKVSLAIRALRAVSVRRVRPVGSGHRVQPVAKVVRGTAAQPDKWAVLGQQAARAEVVMPAVLARVAAAAKAVCKGLTVLRVRSGAPAQRVALAILVQLVQAAKLVA